MFGYVRPVMDKLGEEDCRRFHAAYCGLCHELGARSGAPARLILNYDFTFLAIVLSGGEGEQEHFRCPFRSFRREERLVSSRALQIAADESVIMAYWKLRDEIEDSAGPHAAACRVLAAAAAPANRRAEARCPEFARLARENLSRLRVLEQERCASIDRPADAFAGILSAAAYCSDDPGRQAVLGQLLYHLGRWIYLIDALDDLAEDAAKGRYNPLICRFGAVDGTLDGDSRQRLIATLDHSVNLLSSAFALAEWGQWKGVLENIIYYGLPSTGRLVLEGRWPAQAKDSLCRRGQLPVSRGTRERMEPDP